MVINNSLINISSLHSLRSHSQVNFSVTYFMWYQRGLFSEINANSIKEVRIYITDEKN